MDRSKNLEDRLETFISEHSNGDSVIERAVNHQLDGNSDVAYPWTVDDIETDKDVVERMVELDIVNEIGGGYYQFRDAVAVSEAVKGIGNDTSYLDDVTDPNIPDDIFSVIIGYDKIKRRFVRALDSKSVRQSILLVGPRGSAKSVFMKEVMRMPGTTLMGGRNVTVAGAQEEFLGASDTLSSKPDYIITDEFDKVDPKVYDAFLNYQDPEMPYTVSKSTLSGEIPVEEKAPVFATANEMDRIPEPNDDRFWTFHFEKYDDDMFREVLSRMLPRDHNVTRDVAEYIADQLREWDEGASIRDAERVAEVAKSKRHVDEEIETLQEYS